MNRPLIRFRSVREKLFAVVLITSLAALIVTGVSLFFYDLRTYQETSAKDLAIQAELVGRATGAALQFDDRRFAEENLGLLRARPAIRAAALYNAKGSVFAKYLRDEEAAANGVPALPGTDGTEIKDDRIHAFRRIVENQEIVGTVYLEADAETSARVASYVAIATTVMVASLLVSILLSSWLQAGITMPIIEVARLSRQVVERKDFSMRATRTTDDEVGTLVDAFNDMLSEIQARTAALEASKRDLEREIAEREQADREVRRLNEELEERVRERTAQLQETNRQLESFSYSVSHDLRAPLRAIDGFGQALIEDYGEHVNEGMRRYLGRIRAATLRMAQLIDDLLNLARISRVELSWSDVDLTAMARQVLTELKHADSERHVEMFVWDDVTARGDPRLLRIVLENLLGNAWKFTRSVEHPRIEFGMLRDAETCTFFVRDNGAGFDMAHVDKLFVPFQRLHAMNEFPGTGIGLTTVQRVVHKHGGRIWAHAQRGKGATFYFTLGVHEAGATAPLAGEGDRRKAAR